MIWACQCGYHPTILESKTVFCERFGELRKTNPRFGNSCRPRLVHLWYISTPWSLTVHTGMKRFTVTSSLRSHTQSKLLNIATNAFHRNSRLLPLTFVCYSLLSEKPMHPVFYLFFFYYLQYTYNDKYIYMI